MWSRLCDFRVTWEASLTYFLVAGVQLYNRHFVSVRPPVQSDFSEPVGVRKLKFGTNEDYMTV